MYIIKTRCVLINHKMLKRVEPKMFLINQLMMRSNPNTLVLKCFLKIVEGLLKKVMCILKN